MVSVNDLEQTFMYEDGTFYLDEGNNELQRKEMEEHQELIAVMKADGKTEDEIKEAMEGKGTQYIDRIEYILDSTNDLQALITKAISSL